MNDSTNTNNNMQAASNPATQTLFRFVSLRNPQLAKREENSKFIFRNDSYRGVFDTLLDGWAASGKSKIDFLTEQAKSADFNFGNIKRTEADIESWFGNFYISSKKLVTNGSLPADEVNMLKGLIDTISQDPVKREQIFTGLWDSIIYQILTQENFYIKELLTQILQTIHYVKNYNTFSSEQIASKKLTKQTEVATAKVVIPDSLFIDSVPVDAQINAFRVGFSAVGSDDPINGKVNQGTDLIKNAEENGVAFLPSESVLKRQKVASATYEKTQLEALKKELFKAQNIYKKQYAKAYDLASKDYQDLVKPVYDDYEQQLLQVEATFTKEMTDASKKLALSQVAKPEVPEFQFEFRKERDISFLHSKLSEASLRSFVDLIGEYAESENLSGRLHNGEILSENIVAIGNDQFVLPEDENQNFEEILETINAKLSDLNDLIYQNTEVEKQEYVSVGGVLIPVTQNSISNVIIRDAEFCAYESHTNSGIVNIGGRMSISDSSTFSDVSYNISNGNIIVKEGNNYNLLRTNDGVLEIKDLFNNQLSVADFNRSNTFIMKCKIDGLSTTLTVDISNQGCNRAELISVPNDNPTSPDSSDSFIPKGFGIKRLGIADYLKVEQSTHAYVEGEVANIENIMAREYREKSTRRLRRSEVTETTSSDTEREQLTDTTTASRFEMQSEIAKIMQDATDRGISANTGYSGGGFSINVAASYASHRSKEESMRQAVTQAQDITARALDRVVTKVHQERIEKIVEEFEENNSHGFDNRKGDKHVVGVYRWVDKLMKNQVWNYGKRLMFEFAVPQPAKLHLLAMNSREKIAMPVDPRKVNSSYNLKDFSQVNSETIKYWSGIYSVDLEKFKDTINISLPISFSVQDKNDSSESEIDEIADGKFELEIPEGYSTTNLANIEAAIVTENTLDPGIATYITVGNVRHEMVFTSADDFRRKFSRSIDNLGVYEDKVAVSFSSLGFHVGNININIKCELNNRGKLTIFNKIIEAYEDAMTEYNNKVAEEETKANNIKGSNPLFYRQIEQEVLKHNCIAYLTDDKSRTKNIGTKMYTGDQLLDFKVDRTDINEYTSFAKFMEQAFEWDIMSYNLYPYYWGNKTEWGSMYVSEDADPLFRSFLRSGMARVIVTVRPGFEDAVQFYMSTGRLWNGGEVPVIGDPMYLSIVDELKDVKGEPQGKPWITRLPTSLTILQAQSIGLTVSSALPFTKEDPALFENPEAVVTASNFSNNDAMIESGADKQVAKIGLDEDALQLTTEDDQVVSELSLEDLKEALE